MQDLTVQDLITLPGRELMLTASSPGEQAHSHGHSRFNTLPQLPGQVWLLHIFQCCCNCGRLMRQQTLQDVII